jgi:hypothetical protein
MALSHSFRFGFAGSTVSPAKTDLFFRKAGVFSQVSPIEWVALNWLREMAG